MRRVARANHGVGWKETSEKTWKGPEIVSVGGLDEGGGLHSQVDEEGNSKEREPFVDHNWRPYPGEKCGQGQHLGLRHTAPSYRLVHAGAFWNCVRGT